MGFCTRDCGLVSRTDDSDLKVQLYTAGLARVDFEAGGERCR